ncbi:MAG: SDR family oxidoreductase [Polyangiales bacterium]
MKSVLVTGASTGIGRASVLLLAREGFRVFAGVRKSHDAEVLAAESPAIVPLILDVTDGRSISAALDAIGERLDGVVNNAGIGITAPIEHAPLDEVRRQFEVNVVGLIAVTQACLPLLRRARGRVVNIGSIGSQMSIPFGGILCATKSAVRAIDESLRLELHPFGIHVALIEPAAIATPAVEKMLGDVDQTLSKLSADGQEHYGTMLRTFTERAYARESTGSPPEVVARAVHHALTAARPHTRYLVGKDAHKLAMLARTLPDRLLDRVRLRLFGMPSGFGALRP